MDWIAEARQNRRKLIKLGLVVGLTVAFVMGAWNHLGEPPKPIVEGAEIKLPADTFGIDDLKVRFGPAIKTAEDAIAAARKVCTEPSGRRLLSNPLKAELSKGTWCVSSVTQDRDGAPQAVVFLRADGRGHPLCMFEQT